MAVYWQFNVQVYVNLEHTKWLNLIHLNTFSLEANASLRNQGINHDQAKVWFGLNVFCGIKKP